ncbi:unnamed protein product [Eruca vesicaria subsp. sativa]|uniref:F-box domain-containing protein n=1 Tax=Eruca vesicaria subsp. sativa TaxID=29727 RepID=A0ABC8LE90_ERUVS|nr:unnamed protein product [Eruca vesicaria subsp. sativa]
MKRGRGAIGGCSSSELESKNEEEEEECGLWSLPNDLLLDCLSQVSRLDMVALGMVSKRHRHVAKSRVIRATRNRMGKLEPYLYVFMHMNPEDPSPRWFVLHPLQRRLKPVHSTFYPAPLAGSCFVTTYWGIYCIGGVMNGKPTSEVTLFHAIDHTVHRIVPMKMARSGASACVIDNKIYVFGGCWDDVANSSNWVEVLDLEFGRSWEFLCVSTPKIPLNIQQNFVIDKLFCGVDEDGQIFYFAPQFTPPTFITKGIVEPNPENRNDWLLFEVLLSRGICGRLLWRWPGGNIWRQVKGLEELLQQQHIIKVCGSSMETIAIFWEAGLPQQEGLLELWYADISLKKYQVEEGLWEIWGSIQSSAPVLSYSSRSSPKLLYADDVSC